jgi:hypothetical protein
MDAPKRYICSYIACLVGVSKIFNVTFSRTRIEVVISVVLCHVGCLSFLSCVLLFFNLCVLRKFITAHSALQSVRMS